MAVWVRGLVFASLYLVAMVACIALTRFGAQVAPIWISSAILAWALITAPHRDWPVLAGLTAAAHVIGGIAVGDPIELELIYLVANLTSPVALALLLRWRNDVLEFEDRGELFRFILFAGVLAPALSTGIVAGASAVSGGLDARTLGPWYLADALSFLVLLPLFRIIASNGWRTLFAPQLRTRAIILLGLLAAAHGAAALMPAAGYRLFMMLSVVYLIYVAFELGLTGARAALSISALLSLAYGLFAPAPADRLFPPQEFLLVLQIYVAVKVACVLPIAVVLEERQRLYETAAEALSDAQQAWGEVLAAEAQYRLIADHTTDIILKLAADGRILFASPAAATLKGGADGLAGANLFDLLHEEDRPELRRRLADPSEAGDAGAWRPRLSGADGDWRVFEARVDAIAPDAEEVVLVLRPAAQAAT